MKNTLKWYVQREGQSAGPFSIEDLRDQVKQGLILGHDQVFCEGETQWKRAFDWPELATEAFAEERMSFTRFFTLPQAAPSAEEWIVLIRIEQADGLKFQQRGPIATAQVRELLASGEIKPSDHVWRKGYSAWKAIYLESEFSPALWSQNQERAAIPQGDADDPPQIEMPPAAPALDEPEVALAAMNLPSEPEPVPAPKVQPALKMKKQKGGDSPPAAPVRSLGRHGSRWVLPTVGLALFLALGFAYQNRGKLRGSSQELWKVHETAPPQVAEVLEGEPDVPAGPTSARETTTEEMAESEAPEQEAVVASAPAVPTQKLPSKGSQAVPEAPPVVDSPKPLSGSWSFSISKFDTQMPVTLILIGASGKVLGVPAVYLRTTLRVPANGSLTVHPKNYRLPEGEYLVQLEQNGRSLGKHERKYVLDSTKFDRKLAAHRKQIVYKQQQEKKELLRKLDEVQRFLAKYRNDLMGSSLTARSKKTMQKDFDRLDHPSLRLVRQMRHDLMYATAWSQLSSHHEQLRQLVQSAGTRRPASRQNVDSYSKKVQNLRAQVRQMSLQ